ncbi:MAG: hypothetical protein OXT65_03805 [Alphaproteobacteria bacterium]|nr:hypothetical protein [Alphaproteobacteria bacterium]
MKRALIIGGTGMLAAATRMIAADYDEVMLMSRKPEQFARQIGAIACPMDWENRATTESVLSHLSHTPFSLILSWVHDNGLWCIPHFETMLEIGGRSIRVYSSTAGDPAYGLRIDPPPRKDITRQSIVLGWIKDNGHKRWLTDNEISHGIVSTYNQPEKPYYVVGCVK